MASNKYYLGDLITQRREKNPGGDLPIRGVSKEGLQPPKQIDADTSIYNLYYRNDFIYNPARMELGSIAFNDEYDRAICSSLYEVFYVHRMDLVIPEYLALFVKHPEFARYCNYIGNGSAREYCRFDNISGIPIYLPSINEQRKIVHDYQVITDRIALLRKMNEKLEEAEQTILLKTLSMKETTMTPLGDIADFIDGDRGKNYPTFEEFYEEGYCLFLSAINVTSNGFDFENCIFVTEEKDKTMNKGHLCRYDIVLTSRGTLGNVAFYDSHIPYENVRINSGMLIIRPKRRDISSYFLYALLKSDYMRIEIEKFKSGSAQPQLPIRDLQKVSFPIPVDGQDLVSLSSKLHIAQETISLYTNENNTLKRVQRSVLAKMSS